MSLNRREMLRLGAYGAGGPILSSAASSQRAAVSDAAPTAPSTPDPLAPLARPSRSAPAAPGGIDPQLFARAKAALDRHQI